jgi:myo-inositol-1-phosphate synthase
MEATTLGGLPLMAEVTLEVWDSPNSAVRCAKLGLDLRIRGVLIGQSSYS